MRNVVIFYWVSTQDFNHLKMAHLNFDQFVDNAVPAEHKKKLNTVIAFGKTNRDGTQRDDHLLKISQMMDGWDGVVATALQLGGPIQQEIKHTYANLGSQKYVVFYKNTVNIITLNSNDSYPLPHTSNYHVLRKRMHFSLIL